MEDVQATQAKDAVLVSHRGVPLTRATTFRFTLDPSAAQEQVLLTHAGAARLAFNHLIARVKANLDQRAAERSYGIAEADLTPALSWSKVAFINHINAWKDGRDPSAVVNEDGTRGLVWRGEVSADVFETASVNAAQALANWSNSRSGERAGTHCGFPLFKSKRKTPPTFRLRAKYREGRLSPVRPTGPRGIRFPKLGELRVRESTKRLRRMLDRGRFHVYAAAFRYERGRWLVAITGAAAEFHHGRRSAKGRHPRRVGVDVGLRTLAVVADDTGRVLHAHEGVKALQHAQERLKLANQRLARTKRGSTGRTRAVRRLGRMHARVARLRRNALHNITTELACRYAFITIEDLHAAGMLKNRKLARALFDASFGEIRRQLEYKSRWYGAGLVVADRWYPSSKVCSGCGRVAADLTLSDRVYACPACGLVLDRDVNAAINLARYSVPARARPAA